MGEGPGSIPRLGGQDQQVVAAHRTCSNNATTPFHIIVNYLMLEASTPSSLATGLVRASKRPEQSFCRTIWAISKKKFFKSFYDSVNLQPIKNTVNLSFFVLIFKDIPIRYLDKWYMYRIPDVFTGTFTDM